MGGDSSLSAVVKRAQTGSRRVCRSTALLPWAVVLVLCWRVPGSRAYGEARTRTWEVEAAVSVLLKLGEVVVKPACSPCLLPASSAIQSRRTAACLGVVCASRESRRFGGERGFKR